ncbi:hypothetical protein OG874_35600 [Nocardia sp. NBC_00565]|uniref:hypothetical protein n=1 Tax=Nocardia sp. NBC_00565 TaxID=2975993 RepID=UPI002E80D1A1|nr:hypothetical protein [Nocardia sp. NBC_00565]WUC02016.1 hypothetical protein OG874_35600 [Nocardia sp. NBC_00565]
MTARSITRLEFHGTEAAFLQALGAPERQLPLIARWVYETQQAGSPLTVAAWEEWVGAPDVDRASLDIERVEQIPEDLDFEYTLKQDSSAFGFRMRVRLGRRDRQWLIVAEGDSLVDLLEVAYVIIGACRDRVARQRRMNGMGAEDPDTKLPTVSSLAATMRELNGYIEDAQALTFGMPDPDAYWSEQAEWQASQPFPNLSSIGFGPTPEDRITVGLNTFGSVPNGRLKILDYVPASVAAAYLTGLNLWATQSPDIRIIRYRNDNRSLHILTNTGEERVYFTYYTPDFAAALAADARRWCDHRAVAELPDDWADEAEYVRFVSALLTAQFEATDRCRVVGRTYGWPDNAIVTQALDAAIIRLWGSTRLAPKSIHIGAAPTGSPADVQLTW